MIKEGEYKEIAPSKHFMLVNNYNEIEMREIIRDWIRARVRLGLEDLAEKSEITMMELRFVPIWIVNVSADTTYHGKKKIVEVESYDPDYPSSGSIEIRKERWVDKSGHFSCMHDWKILATKEMSLPLGNISVTRKIPFKLENVPSGAKLINGDVDEMLAKEEADSCMRSHHRARTGVEQLLSINTRVRVGKVQFLTVPFWFTQYKYKNKLYPVVLNGSSGEVVKGNTPRGKYDILIIAGIVAAIITIFLAIVLLLLK